MTSFRLLVAILLTASSVGFASSGNSRHVYSHDQTLVVTDPAKGSNSYRRWAVFPNKTTEYRKVVLWITYRCPDGLNCGEWDYIDGIFLRRIGGSNQKSKNIEIARMISPYGSRFDSTWSFSWHTDVTDFGFLLHDSVEVDFVHTGYESNTDRGWLITLDFEITEGAPAMECLGMDTLWCGDFAYGDKSKPIEKALRSMKFEDKYGADFARLRIVQTGHGMDDSENCAEFCSKTREIIFDDSLIDSRKIWRKCGDNPLYPQAGTWIFDRANWCPGSVVFPDVYDVPLDQREKHSVGIRMENYINSSKPSANYHIYSYLFYYRKPTAKNDVSLEEIITPSLKDEYSRLNPVSRGARIVVKNNGSEPLTSMSISYGIGRLGLISWRGRIESGKLDTIDLPGPIEYGGATPVFKVEISSTNGSFDEYPGDNAGASQAIAPPVYGNQMIVALRTNRDSAQIGYQILDQFGSSVQGRPMGSLAANTNYSDTLWLSPGSYELVVSDSGGDGLDFWFNQEGGYGYVRLLDVRGRLIKSFLSDFGSEIRYSFIVVQGAVATRADDEIPVVNPFPPRNQGIFDVDIFLNEPTVVRLFITDEKDTRLVMDTVHTQFKEGMIPVDISGEPDGIYFVKVTASGRTVSRRIRIKHNN